MEIDHIIPVSQGGDSTLDNLVTACRRCNRKKAARTPEEAGMTVLPVRTEKRR
jgi:5-methylcytosine-specific restriction endonuclease McrA